MITLQIYGILLKKTLMSELDNDHSALKQYAQKKYTSVCRGPEQK